MMSRLLSTTLSCGLIALASGSVLSEGGAGNGDELTMLVSAALVASAFASMGEGATFKALDPPVFLL